MSFEILWFWDVNFWSSQIFPPPPPRLRYHLDLCFLPQQGHVCVQFKIRTCRYTNSTLSLFIRANMTVRNWLPAFELAVGWEHPLFFALSISTNCFILSPCTETLKSCLQLFLLRGETQQSSWLLYTIQCLCVGQGGSDLLFLVSDFSLKVDGTATELLSYIHCSTEHIPPSLHCKFFYIWY